jgi:hypothetical protein
MSEAKAARTGEQSRSMSDVLRRTRVTGLAAREYRLLLVASALVVIHIVDDEFLQPQPGTSAGDHLSAGLVPIGFALFAVFAYQFLRPGLRSGISLSFGILALVAGGIALGGARADGVSGSEWTGLVLLPVGLTFLGLAVWVAWRERGSWARTRRRRWVNRVIAVVAGALVLFFFVFPVGVALWTTHKFRTPIEAFSVPTRTSASGRATDSIFPAGTCRRRTGQLS